MGVMSGKIGEGVARYRPQQTRFYFWGSYVCANFSENRSRNVTVRVPTDGQINRHTHWQTQTDFIICPMLYAIAMGQIIIVTYLLSCTISKMWWFNFGPQQGVPLF